MNSPPSVSRGDRCRPVEDQDRRPPYRHAYPQRAGTVGHADGWRCREVDSTGWLEPGPLGSLGMRKVALVVVALVGLVALPMRAPMGEMTGMTGTTGVDRSAESACRIVECPSMPVSTSCLTVCIAVVALLGGVSVVRRSLASGRVRVAWSPFVDQLAGSSIFRPPRVI